MKSFGILSAILAAAALCFELRAANGVTVTTFSRWTEKDNLRPQVPECAITDYSDSEYQPARILRFNIRDNVAVSCDTIYKATFANFPVLNLDGTKVAFRRWSARIENGQLVDGNGPKYLAVMDIDGGNVTDVIRSDERESLIDWARIDGEDWIFYMKKSALEIWKVKPSDPSTNTLAYVYRSSQVDNWWRWDICADGTRAMINNHWTNGGYGNFPHTLPFASAPGPGGEWENSVGSCNGGIAPSGRFVCGFASHAGSSVQRWDPGNFPWGSKTIYVPIADAAESLGVYTGHAMEMHRFSANSDKWLCQAPTGGYQARWEGGNQLLTNWVDREFIMTTRNDMTLKANMPEATIIYYSCLGDFWIEGPSGCYEDSAGNWVSLETGEPVAVSPAAPGVHCGSMASHGHGPRLVRTAGGVCLTMLSGGSYFVDLLDVTGRCLGSIAGRGTTAYLPETDAPAGVALVKVTDRNSGRHWTLRLARKNSRYQSK